jgi:hypothetical protein
VKLESWNWKVSRALVSVILLITFEITTGAVESLLLIAVTFVVEIFHKSSVDSIK